MTKERFHGSRHVLQGPGAPRQSARPAAPPPDFDRLSLLADDDTAAGSGSAPVINEDVHSVVLALCKLILQQAVAAGRLPALSPGAVHQVQVDMRALQVALPLPQLLPSLQEVVASCEARCTDGAVTLLPAARVDELRLRSTS